MIDFTHNPIIPADYTSRGRGLPYEASPFGCLFFASILAFLLLRLMQQFFDRDAVELRERAEIRRAGVGRARFP